MSKWIPVSERLPDKWIVVLVAVCPKYQMDEVHMGCTNKKGEWEVIDEKGNHTDFITHWMPLPEPPK